MTKSTKSIFKLVLISFLGFFAQFFVNMYVARHVSDAIYGDFCLALQILNVYVFIVIWGTNLSADRFLSKYYKQRSNKQIKTYFSWNIKLMVYTFLVGLCVSLTAFSVMMLLHMFGVKGINEYHLVIYMIWLFPFSGGFLLLYGYLANTNKIAYSQLYSQLFIYVIQFILFFLVVLFIDPLLRNTSLILVLFLSYVILSILSLFTLNRGLLSLFFKSFKIIKKTSLKEQKGLWLNTSSRLTFQGMVASLFYSIDLIVIELMTHNQAYVGHYAAAITITNIIWVIFDSMYSNVIPDISSLLEKNKNAEIQKRFHNVNFFALCVGVILVVIIFLFEKRFLMLFGPSYMHAVNVVTLLAIAAVVGSYASMSCYLLMLGGYDLLALNLALATLIFAIIIMVPLTYFYGIVGTAVAMLCAYIFRIVIMCHYCRKKLGIRFLKFI